MNREVNTLGGLFARTLHSGKELDDLTFQIHLTRGYKRADTRQEIKQKYPSADQERQPSGDCPDDDDQRIAGREGCHREEHTYVGRAAKHQKYPWHRDRKEHRARRAPKIVLEVVMNAHLRKRTECVVPFAISEHEAAHDHPHNKDDERQVTPNCNCQRNHLYRFKQSGLSVLLTQHYKITRVILQSGTIDPDENYFCSGKSRY